MVEEEQEFNEPQEEIKPKSKLSQDRLDKLAQARQKALEKRRQLKDLKEKEKALQEKQFHDRVKVVNEQLNEKPKVTNEVKPPSIRRVKKTNVIAQQYESSSEDSSSDDEIPVQKPRKAQKQYNTHELTASIAKEQLQERLRQENLRQAFSSLFPGHSMQLMMG